MDTKVPTFEMRKPRCRHIGFGRLDSLVSAKESEAGGRDKDKRILRDYSWKQWWWSELGIQWPTPTDSRASSVDQGVAVPGFVS